MAAVGSALRHFLRNEIGLSQKEAASYVKSVRGTGLNTADQESELIGHLSSKYKAALNGGTHDDAGISEDVYHALSATNTKGEGLGGRIWGAGEHRSIYNPDNTPSTPKGGFDLSRLGKKDLKDYGPKSVQGIFKKAYDSQKMQEELASRKRIAGYMRDNEAAAAAAENNKGVKGVINSVKSSVTNMKAKYDKATEALYEIAGKNHTPTEFQQQTTAMVGKFSGGKWTGGVNTEKMSWLEANAHENLYSSVGRDYDNLIAKMQGAKTQEEFSKLMEDHHIKYSDGMSGAELNKNINAHFNERIDGGPGVGNYVAGNKVASAAMLGVAGASVLALSDSRGRRSNSQLYSSQI